MEPQLATSFPFQPNLEITSPATLSQGKSVLGQFFHLISCCLKSEMWKMYFCWCEINTIINKYYYSLLCRKLLSWCYSHVKKLKNLVCHQAKTMESCGCNVVQVTVYDINLTSTRRYVWFHLLTFKPKIITFNTSCMHHVLGGQPASEW